MTKTQLLNEANQQKEATSKNIKELIGYIDFLTDDPFVQDQAKSMLRIVQGRLGLIEDALWGINQ